ncbi:MAG: helix-hairpin-helix domain-containing protein, partial [Clostridia bacterium]
GFVNVEELMRVEGIGVALFKKLRPLVCVCGMVTTQTTELLSINTANAQALVGLPGIGEKLAAEIVANRAQYGRFDLLRVPGIGERKLRAMLPFIARDAAGKLP